MSACDGKPRQREWVEFQNIGVWAPSEKEKRTTPINSHFQSGAKSPTVTVTSLLVTWLCTLQYRVQRVCGAGSSANTHMACDFGYMKWCLGHWITKAHTQARSFLFSLSLCPPLHSHRLRKVALQSTIVPRREAGLVTWGEPRMIFLLGFVAYVHVIIVLSTCLRDPQMQGGKQASSQHAQHVRECVTPFGRSF